MTAVKVVIAQQARCFETRQLVFFNSKYYHMAHENCKDHYSDWQSTVHCSFKNVFTSSIAHIVGNNLQKILGIHHFKPDEMARQAPTPYNFTCKRKEANSIRDELAKITTDSYTYIWFSMQTDPFHYIYNRRSMLGDDPIKVTDYPVFYYFGSMYSYSTFTTHSEQHPTIHNLRITKWREQPETIRIMSNNESRLIFIPVKWIQKPILVNLKDRPCVVLMLKYSVKMKRKITVNGKSTYERVCKIGEDGFETIVSKSSDILLSFHDVQHTYAFLDELTRETDEYRDKFTINFVTLKRVPARENNQSFYLPPSASHKQHYALKMLFSLGYLFQDKYGKQLHDQFVAFDKELFNEMCYDLKEKLEDNHCYNIKRVFEDFTSYIKEKRKEEKQSGAKKLPYCIGCISVTPLRVLYQRMESTIGNRALRMPQFGGEDMFLLIHIREEDNQKLKDFDPSIKRRLKSKMLHGIKALGKTYRLFGTSTSQLKEMSFWFIDIGNKPIEQAWKELGDFSDIKNVANYVARIGLYFTTSYTTGISFKFVEKFSPDKKFIATRIDDVETEDQKYKFTDGIGKMSWGVAGLVAIKLNIKLESRDDIPSAYQVRIAGCKGMLAIDPESRLDQYYIKVRDSMEKFKSDNWDLEICEYSKPLELKFNNQVIMLLSDLGNKDAVFESYQTAAITNLCQQNENEQLRKLRYSTAKADLLKNKIPLPLNEGRNMFGIVDETGTLEYGQVFIQYKDLDSPHDNTFIVLTGEVLVAKNPCLYPGDFRKFTAINVPALKACIRDCIVFPRKGPRPHPNEMSGSDLDGDQYWVYWGKFLKIGQMDEPLSYEAAPKKPVLTINNEIIINHIIESFGAGSQGIICDVHLAIADSDPNRTRSADCKYLAELFSRAIDAPKTGETINLDKVYELRAKCRGYPLFMKKYDQPIRESNSILNKLFIEARRHFFSQLHLSSPVQPPCALAKAPKQRKTGPNGQDKEFQQWLSSHGILGSEENTNEAQPILVNSSTTKKPRESINITKSLESLIEQPSEASVKQTKKAASKKEETGECEPAKASSLKAKRASIDIKSPEPSIEQATEASNKQTKKVTSKKDEETESEPAQASSIKAKKTLVESGKSKETKEKEESSDVSKKLINSAASSVIPKGSFNASSISENISNRNIVFNGMTTVANRLKWNQTGDRTFTVDLDAKTTGEKNGVDKVVQLMLDSGKTASFPSDTKLTLIISWGELFLKIPQAIDDTKPKNIKDLNQLIKENDYVEFAFREHDIKTIAKKQEPSSKSGAEYVLVCKCRDLSPNDISLIFDDKKKLKKLSFISIWWACGIRGGEELMDSFYEIRYAPDAIDSKHESFSFYLKSLFKNPNEIDLLSGTSPQISIASELLKSTIQIVSLKRFVCCEYANLNQRMFGQPQFDTLKNLEYAFYQVTDISTEKINGRFPTRDTIEFHATQIQIAKKHEQDLKQLATFAEEFFD